MENNEVLKETSLLYFSDALINQAYEECPNLVKIAKEFGALQSDIDEVITDYLEGRKIKGKNEAKLGNNRQNILQEG